MAAESHVLKNIKRNFSLCSEWLLKPDFAGSILNECAEKFISYFCLSFRRVPRIGKTVYAYFSINYNNHNMYYAQHQLIKNIIKAETDEHINMARTLFLEYEKELGINLCFQNFKNELKNLPCKYAEPAGALLIAENKFKNPAGRVALKKLSANGICEMKRLFVKPDCRTKGVGVRDIYLCG
jgi:hypothetical protein